MVLLFFCRNFTGNMIKNRLKHTHPGFFISFEGPEGAGKSTQLRLLRGMLEREGRRCVATREPGGTPLAEQLREIVKNFSGPEKLHPTTELLLLEAARSQHVREVIRPALAAGCVVLCDRFFDSTSAYQGGARGLGSAVIDELNGLAAAECIPDLTILLDLSPEAGFRRTAEREETRGLHDRFEEEKLDFHRRVREAFLKIAAAEPERVRVVDADRAPELVHAEIGKIVHEAL